MKIRIMTAINLLWILCCHLLYALSVPLPEKEIEKRAFDCEDTSPAAIFDSRCWGLLKLTEFVNQWSVPLCGPNSTGKNCSLLGEPWSTTFLRLAKGQAGFDCTKICMGSCHYDSDLDPNLNKRIKAQVRYVTYTIFSQFELLS